MKRTTNRICLAFLISVAAHAGLAQGKREMAPDDALRIAAVGDAQISPDGGWVVYTVAAADGEAQTRTTVWIVRLTTGVLRSSETRSAPGTPLLPAGWSGSNPRWSPDSRRIAFRAASGGQSGIWVISIADRQPRFVAPVGETNFHIAYAGESFAWSPDSRRIAFISAGDDQSETAGAAKDGNDPRVIDRIQYKSRAGFSDRRRTHVWVADASSGERVVPRQLTSGQHYDHALVWNPRGDEVAFLSNREPEPEANNNSDIFAVDMDGRVRQITDTRGSEYEPAWSPDGKLIAYTATKRDVTTIDSVAEDAHVWVVDGGGGSGRELTAAQDRRARRPLWSPDGRSIFFLAGDRGETLIYRVGADGGAAPFPLLDRNSAAGRRGETSTAPPSGGRPFQVSGFSLSSRAPVTFAFTLSDSTHPAEVWVRSITEATVRSDLGTPPLRSARRLSAHNDALVQSVRLVEPEEINFKSFDATNVQGWLMKPAGFRGDRRYPLILSVHGGPHGMYGYGFNPAFQVYAARGYGVLYINPRGSSGYGQKFSDGTLREWGGGDYRDLMTGVDEVLRAHAWIDADRLGVTGGSYGGFMTNWIITQTPRFRAAVASASVSNLISFYSTSLYQDLIHAEFGGFPWDDYDLLWRWSPLRYAKQAQTPTLFLHGEQDNDVHITQAEEMYMALKRRGVETVLVRYPREGHGLREPRHRLDALERTVAWFDKFLK